MGLGQSPRRQVQPAQVVQVQRPVVLELGDHDLGTDPPEGPFGLLGRSLSLVRLPRLPQHDAEGRLA